MVHHHAGGRSVQDSNVGVPLKSFDKNAAGKNKLPTNLDYNCAGRLVGCFSSPVRDQGYWMKDPMWLVQKLFGKRGSSDDHGKGR